MDLKRLTRVTYRIESKPGGGFVAHTDDPAAPILEASTREELEQKIVGKILGNRESLFAELKTSSGTKSKIRIERQTPNGTTAEVIENPSPEQMREFAKEFGGIMANFPQLSEALAKAGDSTNVTDTNVRKAEGSALQANADVTTVNNVPITAEDSSMNFFRWVIILLIAAAVAYLFLHHR